MLKTSWFILFILFLNLQTKGQGDDYFFQQISPEHGFTYNGITTISEDENGFLWYGCSDGVFFHNTRELKKIDLYRIDSTRIISTAVNKIYTNKNRLWVCSYDGLFEYNPSLNYFQQKTIYSNDKKQLTNTRFDNILQVENDKFIVIADGRYYLYQDNDTVLKNLDPKGLFERYRITFLEKIKDNIIIGAQRGKVFICRQGYTNPELFHDSKVSYVSSVCRDGNKYLVGYIEHGIDVLNLNGDKIYDYNEKHEGIYHIPNNRVRQILKRENGEIWIGSYKGLSILKNDKLVHLDYQNNVGLPHTSIRILAKGKNGGIWAGTWAGGISYFKDCNYNFVHVNPISQNGAKFENGITSFAEDKYGNVWIGSERIGMSLFNLKLKEIDKNKSPICTSNYGIKNVKTLLGLNNGMMVIGTFEQGLLLFDPVSLQTRMINKDIVNNNASIYRNGELWTGGFDLEKSNVSTKTTESLYSLLRSVNSNVGEVKFLFFDSAQNLWICTNAGLFVKYKNSNTFKECNISTNTDSDKITIYTCLEDIEGRIWLGTKGKGILIYQPETDSAKPIYINNLVTNASVYSLIKDKNDALWFSSNHGIFRYVNEYNAVDHFTEIDGLSGRQFNPNSAYLCSNGDLLFGASNGFNVINPTIIKQNITYPEVFLSKFKINNKPLTHHNTVSCNSLNLAQLKTVELRNDQNTLNIGLVSNNYIKPEKNRFRYRLINYEDTLMEISNGDEISYTKIPPGDYIFEAYGSNNDMLWSEFPLRISISITPPIWRRWYFILGYLLIMSIIIILIVFEAKSKQKLKRAIIAEQYKSQANEFVSSERVKFFVNISHELRTPLSLITSPINALISKFSNDENTQNLLKVVDRNAQRLLKITNQTLDYRLLEVGQLKPNFESSDIIKLATNAYQHFEHSIIEKQINFTFTSEFQKVEIIIDVDMVEKIIFNLISNSIDFTPELGHIFLSISKKKLTEDSYSNFVYSGKKFYGDSIEISIADSGKGISSELLPKIFDRFTKGKDASLSGTGIGLHLCREYAELNDGNVFLTSKIGVGSTFILNLPIKNKLEFEKNKSKNKQIITHSAIEGSSGKSVLPESTEENQANKNTILIVEHNTELRSYLKAFLGQYFNVLTAKNGIQALDIITDVLPELIITEIQFPDNDGLEFVSQIKQGESTRHIHVIVLTSYTDKKTHIESIVRGADTYFPKPVEDMLLLANIKNLLSKNRVSNASGSSTTNKRFVRGLSLEVESFIAIAEKIVEENFQNINFSSHDLAASLGVSKSTLFRKIKTQTNLGTTEFIRDVRLKNAVKLMENKTLNIDEIGTSVGFNSTSYFIRSFKRKYGTTPGEYENR